MVENKRKTAVDLNGEGKNLLNRCTHYFASNENLARN